MSTRNGKKNRKPLQTTMGRAPSTSNIDKPIDLGIVGKPIHTSLFGLHEILKMFDTGSAEVRSLAKYECDILYECRVCRNIFRSFANFVMHKRNYCRESYDSKTQNTNLVQENNYDIIYADLLGTSNLTVESEEDKSNGDSKKTLSLALKKISEKQESKKITDFALTEDLSDESSKDTDTLEERTNIAIESIPNSDAGVFQTMFRNLSAEHGRIDLMKSEVMELHGLLGSDEAVLSPTGCIDTLETNKINDKPHIPQNTLVCTVCNLKFSTRKTLTYHIKYKHNGSRIVYPCPDCKDTFANAWCVFRHLYKVHRRTSAQVKRLRAQVHASAMRRRDEPPKKKSKEILPLNLNKENDVEENQQWINDFEKSNDLQMCGGCGKRFERKAALHSHSQMCTKRSEVCNNIKENTKRIQLEEKDLKIEKTTKVAAVAPTALVKGSQKRKPKVIRKTSSQNSNTTVENKKFVKDIQETYLDEQSIVVEYSSPEQFNHDTELDNYLDTNQIDLSSSLIQEIIGVSKSGFSTFSKEDHVNSRSTEPPCSDVSSNESKEIATEVSKETSIDLKIENGPVHEDDKEKSCEFKKNYEEEILCENFKNTEKLDNSKLNSRICKEESINLQADKVKFTEDDSDVCSITKYDNVAIKDEHTKVSIPTDYEENEYVKGNTSERLCMNISTSNCPIIAYSQSAVELDKTQFNDIGAGQNIENECIENLTNESTSVPIDNEECKSPFRVVFAIQKPIDKTLPPDIEASCEEQNINTELPSSPCLLRNIEEKSNENETSNSENQVINIFCISDQDDVSLPPDDLITTDNALQLTHPENEKQILFGIEDYEEEKSLMVLKNETNLFSDNAENEINENSYEYKYFKDPLLNTNSMEIDNKDRTNINSTIINDKNINECGKNEPDINLDTSNKRKANFDDQLENTKIPKLEENEEPDNINNDSQEVTLEMKSSKYIDLDQLTCLPCKTYFPTFHLLMKHMSIHFKWFSYQCSKCLFMSYDEKSCILHSRAEHNLRCIDNVVLPIPNWKTINISTDFIDFGIKIDDNEQIFENDPQTLETAKEKQNKKVIQEENENTESEVDNPGKGENVRKMVMEVIFGPNEISSEPKTTTPQQEKLSPDKSRPIRTRTKPILSDFVYDMAQILRPKVPGQVKSKKLVTVHNKNVIIKKKCYSKSAMVKPKFIKTYEKKIKVANDESESNESETKEPTVLLTSDNIPVNLGDNNLNLPNDS